MRRLDPAVIALLARRRPHAWLGRIGAEWLLILMVWCLCARTRHVALWALGVLVVGTRQHGIGVLLHDATHFLVCRSPEWNDRLANWLGAYPLFVCTTSFRRQHMRHHRYLDTPRDPAQLGSALDPAGWDFPAPRWRLLSRIARDLGALSFFSGIRLALCLSPRGAGRRSFVVRLGAAQSLIAAIACWAGGWPVYVVLWLLPMVTVLLACYRLRALSDHYGLLPTSQQFQRTHSEPFECTRSMAAGPLMGVVLAPHHVGYHLEHHLYPSVPCYRLGALHRELMRCEDFRLRAHITRGHGQLLRELTRPAPRTTQEGPPWDESAGSARARA